MFAKSEKIEAVGSKHIPLFARPNPAIVTLEGVAKADIKQYQPVMVNISTNEVSLFTGAQVSTQSLRLGIAAYPAKNNQPISFYLEGYFNTAALDVSAIASYGAIGVPDRAAKLNAAAGNGLYFDGSVAEQPVTNV